MATADYYLCDLCDAKTFYDAELMYDYGLKNPLTSHPWPNGVGAMMVICVNCAKEHELKVIKKEVKNGNL